MRGPCASKRRAPSCRQQFPWAPITACVQVAQDILVLITADVSEAARAALREVFDEVVGRASAAAA